MRRDGAARPASPLFDRQLWYAWLVVGLFWVNATLIVLWQHRDVPFRLGDYLDRDVKSRVTFEAQVRLRPEEMRERTPSVFLLRTPVLEQVSRDLREGLAIVRSSGDYELFRQRAAGRTFAELSSADFAALSNAGVSVPDAQFRTAVQQLIDWLKTRPLLGGRPPGVNSGLVMLKQSEAVATAEEMPVTDVVFAANRDAALSLVQLSADNPVLRAFPPPAQPLVRRVLDGVMYHDGQVTALYEFDPRLTRAEQEIRSAPENLPIVSRRYERGNTLASAGIVDEFDYVLLEQENEQFWNSRQRDVQALRKDTLLVITVMVLVGCVVIGFALYTWYYQRDAIANPRRWTALVALCIIVLFLSKCAALLSPQRIPETSILFIAFGASVVSIVYQSRFAFGAMGLVALLAVLSVSGDLRLFLVLVAGVAVTVFSDEDVRSRLKLVRTALVTAAVTGGVTLLGRLSSFDIYYDDLPASDLAHTAFVASGWAALAAVLSGFLTLGMLPIIERTFNTATSLTLLEYSDPNQPLLQRLAVEAPGTDHHSRTVSMLAEAAVNAIGGNGLLARVGALYHDVGKINKPLYFVENQTGQFNRHDQLTPAMSLLVIVGHVKDGLELAKEYKLPPVLLPFIAEHHGTTLVEYFFHAATKGSKARDDTQIAEVNFRYPGPKPQSKETAMLMLCDSVEAATRSMPEPTSSRIEALVSSIARKKLDDGQFDEADITFRQLAAAERAITKTLISMYHGRVSYPTHGKSQPPAGTQPPGVTESQSIRMEERRDDGAQTRRPASRSAAPGGGVDIHIAEPTVAAPGEVIEGAKG